MNDEETPVEPLNGAGLAPADEQYDQDDFDEAEADRQLTAVDEEA